MRLSCYALLSFCLLTPPIVFAQHSICGDPPPVANESLKGEIAGKAQLLSRYIGDAQLSGKIENTRTEIFSKYPDAERSRANAYFYYQVCVLVMNDKNMTTQQKLEELKKVRREFDKVSLDSQALQRLSSARQKCSAGDFTSANVAFADLLATYPGEESIQAFRLRSSHARKSQAHQKM